MGSGNEIEGSPELFSLSVMRKREELWGRVWNFICFPNFPGKQQHFNFNVSKVKLRYYFLGKSFLFSDKSNLNKVSGLFMFFRGTQKTSVRRH